MGVLQCVMTETKTQWLGNKGISRYYNENQIVYDLFWSRDALHFGLWDSQTKSLRQALSNTNQFIVDTLKIDSDDIVLDAGCGIGGTSVFIAQQTGASVVGITLSRRQLHKARKKAARAGVSHLVKFYQQDFSHTEFKEASFTKIFGIESICYAPNKRDFLKEAYRILQPGGTIAVLDAFLIKTNLTEREQAAYNDFLRGWVVPDLAVKSEFFDDMQSVGFQDIVFEEKLKEVKKSSEHLHRLGRLAYPLTKFFSAIKLMPKSTHGNSIASIAQKKLVDMGVVTYGVFVGRKVT